MWHSLTAKELESVKDSLESLWSVASLTATLDHPLSPAATGDFSTQIDAILNGHLNGKMDNPIHQGLTALKEKLNRDNPPPTGGVFSYDIANIIDICAQAQETIAAAEQQAAQRLS